MAAITKLINISKISGSLCNRLSGLHIQNTTSPSFLRCSAPKLSQDIKYIQTTSAKCDLMEFFDDKKNWGENEVKVGRSWRKDELRIKSNTDLHKLWFVLLKEKNMLLTMEHECNDKMELFPSPERIDKVKESMENLEQVVRERNKAYYLLETGTTGERPGRVVASEQGIKFYYRSCEYAIPKIMNTKWKTTHKHRYGGYAVRRFLRLYREKLYNVKRKAKNRDRNHIMMLLRRNQNLDVGLLKEKYPHVDIDKLLKDDKCRGHFVPKL